LIVVVVISLGGFACVGPMVRTHKQTRVDERYPEGRCFGAARVKAVFLSNY
jgi:hypothetical protein